MKRFFIALAATIGLGSAASAQNLLFENPDNKPYFGARVGLDVTSTAGETYDTYTNGAGFNVGAIYNIPVVKNFYFEPGLSLFYNTFGQEISVDADFPIEIKTSIRNFGFRVPFNFGYRFDFTDDMSIYIYTGPVLNINITAKEHFDGNGTMVSSTHSLMGNGFKRADMQWDFGVGYSYNNLYVQVGGGVGVTKVFSSAVESFRRNTFNLAVGYNF
ncbi:MAG: PorT family protein [Muribaculaceae bacterium]|nr:PorT family protein [Muribaculaceae bacterium]